MKRIALELGGKSANILLPDLEGDELAKATKAAVGSAFLNSGQTCTAFTRLLVPADKHDAIVDALRDEVESTYTIGDPATGAGRLGPLISATQRDRVRGYIQKGIDEGATLVTGGPEQPDDLPTGYFVKPTVFAGVRNDMVIAQEEIFGPVLSVIPYDSVDEAVDIANDSPYGLSGGVWGADVRRSHGRRPTPPHRRRRGQRRQLQPARPVRRLQAVGHRPRGRQVRPRGVPPDQVPAALSGVRTPTSPVR